MEKGFKHRAYGPSSRKKGSSLEKKGQVKETQSLTGEDRKFIRTKVWPATMPSFPPKAVNVTGEKPGEHEAIWLQVTGVS